MTVKEDQQAKARATKKAKYGDATFNNSSAIRASKASRTGEQNNATNAKRAATNLEKYGVENLLMLPENSRKTAKGNASVKSYSLPSGRVIGIRGVEDKAIGILLTQYQECELRFHDSYKADCETPVLTYINVNRHSWKYYPDIFIHSENKIIEVKSQWWFDGYGSEKYKSRLENNMRKRQAAIGAGYQFEFWVFDSKGNYVVK